MALQSLSSSQFQVIIVTDAPSRAQKILDLFGDAFEAEVVPFLPKRDRRGHPAAQMRNLGARKARHRRLVFVDSDCILQTDALQRHATCSTILCGCIRELPAIHWGILRAGFYRSFDDIWAKAVLDYREKNIGKTNTRVPGEWSDCYSGNLSLPKELFALVQGFDEGGFRCHDMDLGYRLGKAGGNFTYDHLCRAVHVEHPRSILFRKQQAAGWRQLGKKYPEIRVHADDAALELERLYLRVHSLVEARFQRLLRKLPGIRTGTAIVMPPTTDASIVENELRATPYLLTKRQTATEYALRLHKDCWDYSVILPLARQIPKISVVIPTYHAEATLERAVESVFAQTYQDYEILVIDDGSSFGFMSLLERFLSDRRLRIISRRRNRGIAVALNLGLETCRGEILVQLDSDDWLGRKCLEDLISRFDGDAGIGAVYGAPILHRDGGIKREVGYQTKSPIDHLEYRGVQAPRAYRVEALKAAGGWAMDDAYQGRFFEDRRTLNAVAETRPVVYCSRTEYHVSIRQNSLGRGAPLQAASAKLAITWQQAMKHQLKPRLSYDGRFLQTRYETNSLGQARDSWSVIIPACNTQDQFLRLSLLSWIESDLPSECEIIVVNDGENPSMEVLASLDPRIRVCHDGESKAPAAARNLGARNARGRFLLFSDSDHIVPPCIIRVHEERHQLRPNALVVGGVFGRRAFTMMGPYLPPWRRRQLLEAAVWDKSFAHLASSLMLEEPRMLVSGSDIWRQAARFAVTDTWQARWGELLLQFGESLAHYPHRWMRVGSGSLSIRSKLFEELGGFDEKLLSMEDWELGIRAQKLRLEIISAPDAEPYHQIHPPDPRRPMANRDAVRFLAKRYPEMVSALRLSPEGFRPPGASTVINILDSMGRTEDPRLHSIDLAKPSTRAFPFYALTFDDGPHPVGTTEILEVLARSGCIATFFVLGSRVSRQAALCRMMVSAGHEIGVHAWHHRSASTMTSNEVHDSLSRTKGAIEDATGVSPSFCRPPYGHLTPAFTAVASELSLRIAGWHVAPPDWESLTSKELITSLAESSIYGKVVLLHDGSGDPTTTAAVVGWLTRVCNGAGLTSLNLSQFALRKPLPAIDLMIPNDRY